MTPESAIPGSPTLRKPRFDVAMRGYERSQVDQHLSKLHREMSQLIANLRQEREFARNGSQQLVAERDNALRQLQTAHEELRSLRGSADDTTLELRPKDAISLFGDRLQNILATAEQEARALKSEAVEAAEHTRAEAAQRAEALLSQAQQEAEALVSQARREADELQTRVLQDTEELQERVQRETSELQARTEQETNELRARTEQETSELRAGAKQEADQLLGEAREQARRLTEQANAEAQRVTTSAQQQAAATVDAARREESEVRTSLVGLAQRREQVRRELTEIGAAIEKLLGEVRGGAPAGPQRSDRQPDTAAADEQRREQVERPQEADSSEQVGASPGRHAEQPSRQPQLR